MKKQIYSNKKAYFIDTGMAKILGFRISEDIGRMLENIVFLQLKLIRSTLNVKNLDQQTKILEDQYAKEKAKRGISDELYQKYIDLFQKKSYYNDFFYYLLLAGKNNITILSLNYSDTKFMISGICKDDSRLENAFRNQDVWSNINFNITKTRDYFIDTIF